MSEAIAFAERASTNHLPQGSDQRIRIVSIERRDASTLSFKDYVREYVDKNRPVIITNAVPAWNAVKEWTPEFFKSRFGTKTVQVSYETKMQMGELIDAVKASTKEKPGPYLHKVIIYKDMPELLPDITPGNPYGYPQRFCSPLMPGHYKRPDGFLKLLIGGVGGEFPLMHYDSDNAHALITEVYGHKEFVLFAPEDTPYVYPAPTPDSPVASVNNLDNPDLERFPLFVNATQYRGIIGPGDAAFIPSRWWHSARVVTTSISTCTNMIHASNWRGFVDEACAPQLTRNPLKRAVKRAYLAVTGVILDITETLQNLLPNTPLSKPLSRLAPKP
jgi:hypothetical protein